LFSDEQFMSRILLAWELGRHLGHVSRLLPLAMRLKARDHEVLTVVRDILSASRVLGAAGVPFVQAPRHIGVANGGQAQTSTYADLLLSQGWNDGPILWGMLQAWITLLKMFRPEVVVLDYAPTARLAAHVLNIPCILVGTGFELPPALNPLPPIPGFPWATADVAAASEKRVLDLVNAVLRACQAAPLDALRTLVEGERRFLTTLPELDHYGSRQNETYIGPLADPLGGHPVEWPVHSAKRVFAYLRAEIKELPLVLEGLMAADVSVVAYVSGVASDVLSRFGSSRCVLSSEPVQLAALLDGADACLSYSPAGTVATALLRGVPQLMMPVHMESELTARRVALQGMGRILRKPHSAAQVTQALHDLLHARDVRLRARSFAERHRDVSAAASADLVVEFVEACCGRIERVSDQRIAHN
jgi:UDP:flavonoid glycosyltransferase YjiC (YdhE family)